MPGPYGVTAEGFNPKTLQEIRLDLESAVRATFGEHQDTSPDGPWGQWIGITAERLAEGWDLAEAVYYSMDPDNTSGVPLIRLAAITGTVPLSATKSRVGLTLSGTDGTVIPAGRVVSVTGTGARFATLASVTIAGGTATVEAESEEYGPIAANAGTITTIETAVAGWTDVTNPLDADLGRTVETSAQLRVRRQEELQRPGNAALDAIRTALLDVEDVTAVTVFQNTTLLTVDGMPGKSVEALVQGGAEQDIWDALLASVSAGIETHGTQSGVSEDAMGFTHTMKFSRPTEVPLYLIANLTVDADTYPADGDAQVEAALIALGDTYVLGRNVVASRFVAACFTISGVLDATILQGLTASPSFSATIVVGARELATFDTTRITVNSTPGSL